MRILAWALQILILTGGIHLFLRFVRTTRGSRLIRGLFVMVLGGVVGLWGLSKFLQLEELEHLLKGATGLIVVTLAIVFQSELRRAIAQLGEHSFFGRLIQASGADTVGRVARAAKAMASGKIGALIAFEKEASLHNYIEAGTSIDSAVRARLLESLFYPGAALHDGAVIIREDRIAAAGCFFPLPEEAVIDASMGTRHRAAIGLAEESDAVILIVSEETGAISLAREGQLEFDIPPDRVEERLREMLETKSAADKTTERRLFSDVLQSIRRDLVWLTGSLLLACGILYVTHQDIRETRDFHVRVGHSGPSGRTQPSDGEILVVLPEANHRLVRPGLDERLKISVTGTRAQIDEIGGSLRGVLEISDPEWLGGALELARVDWEDPVLGLGYEWKEGRAPELVVELFAERQLTLRPEDVSVDASALNPRYEARAGEVTFEPGPTIRVRGPSSLLAALGEEEPLALETVLLSPEDRTDHKERVHLSHVLSAKGFNIVGQQVDVIVPILPASHQAGTLTKDISLVCLAPDRAGELARWALPTHTQTARFTVHTSGLIPVNADPGSPAIVERFANIRRFVEENLLVFADIAELPPEGEGRAVPVRWTWRRNWRDSVDVLGLDASSLGEREELRVELESEAEILLEDRGQTGQLSESQPEGNTAGG